jgi:uncharacterized membrane protein YphA (DoxX/SURF4 family)
MDLITLIGIFFASALVLTAIEKVVFKITNLPINFLRNFVGIWFIFSGVVKAIDPAGTGIKMEEYFEIFGQYVPFLNSFWELMAHHALAISIFMIILEIYLGIALILGTWKKLTIWLLVLLILFFTFLTGFSAKTGKVTDCGCFGDFIKLAPIQSFYKDLLLTALILLILFGQKSIKEIFGKVLNRILLGALTIAAIAFTYRNIYYEPIKDFRPYTVGTSIPECLKLPPNAKKSIINLVYTYKNKKTGVLKTFPPNQFPDAAEYDQWEYVKRDDVVVQKGDEPKCKDFRIVDTNGDDQTAMFFEEPETIFFIVSPDLKKANMDGFKKIIAVCEDAMKDGKYAFLISGNAANEVADFKTKIKLPYDTYNMDPSPIKTIMRSNPGLLILKQGKIVAKYHYNELGNYASIKKSVLK